MDRARLAERPCGICGKADGETRFPALLLDQAARFALSVAVLPAPQAYRDGGALPAWGPAAHGASHTESRPIEIR